MNITKEMSEELIQAGWTPPPDKKPVDMSALIDSGIDCDFLAFLAMTPCLGFLNKISADRNKFYCSRAYEIPWTYCKPRMNYWFCHRNFTDSYILIAELREAGFSVAGDDYYNFKITGLRDGYCWPWEKKDEDN